MVTFLGQDARCLYMRGVFWKHSSLSTDHMVLVTFGTKDNKKGEGNCVKL